VEEEQKLETKSKKARKTRSKKNVKENTLPNINETKRDSATQVRTIYHCNKEGEISERRVSQSPYKP
jgi:hypothetical protein